MLIIALIPLLSARFRRKMHQNDWNAIRLNLAGESEEVIRWHYHQYIKRLCLAGESLRAMPRM